MRERQLTGFEIHRLIEENRMLLKDSRVDKIFHSKNDFVIRLRTKPLMVNQIKNAQNSISENKKRKKVSLIFKIPNLFFIKEEYEPFEAETSNFTGLLRKKLNNKVLREISQRGFDRIIDLKFEGKDEHLKLMIELFDKGAILLTDETGRIIAKYGSENAGRTFSINNSYEEPENIIKSPAKIFSEGHDIIKKMLKKTGEKEIVKVLASDYGFGRLYAEEICSRSGIKKMKKSGELTKEELSSLAEKVKEVLSEHKNIIYIKENEPEEVSCVEIKSLNLERREFESFSKAIEEFVREKQAESKKGKAPKKEEIIIKKQKETIERLKKEAEEDKRKAEEIYKHYNEIKWIIGEANRIIKSQGTNKEKKEKILKLNDLLKDKGIKIEEINFKDKKVRISVNKNKGNNK